MSTLFVGPKNPPILSHRGLPFLFYGKNWEGRITYHPQIIEHENNFYLIYTGTTSAKALCFRHDIGLATSNDLSEWKRYRNNPILSPGKKGEWDGDLVAHSFIIKKEEQYFMFYDGSPKGNWHEGIGVAISDDLIHWQKYEKNPVLKSGDFWWDKNHVSRCCVFSDKGKYYMFFAGHDGTCERIGIAKSDDLLSWKKISSDPVLDLGQQGDWDDFHISDPRVLKVDDLYLMFYSGYDCKEKKGRLGLAYSRDLISWQRFKDNPIMDTGKKGDWDDNEAARASMLKTGEKYYLAYSGGRGCFFNIGLRELNLDLILESIKNHDN